MGIAITAVHLAAQWAACRGGRHHDLEYDGMLLCVNCFCAVVYQRGTTKHGPKMLKLASRMCPSPDASSDWDKFSPSAADVTS
eukprot:1156645-Pelagomonas_calceolata.AAC.11